MRYAILADIHSNLEALSNVLDVLSKESIDEYLCVGDLVGYNADPRECIDIIKQHCAKTIAGNHDWACSGRLNTNGFRDIAKEAIIWTGAILTGREKEFLASLELILKFKDLTLVHGTLFKAEQFHYLTGLNYARLSFQVLKTKICFIGHTHKPVIYIMDKNGNISYSFDDKLVLRDGCRYIVNAGSIGQPRDDDKRACFCIYDTDKEYIETRRVDYNFEKTQKKIISDGLSEELALRLSWGR